MITKKKYEELEDDFFKEIVYLILSDEFEWKLKGCPDDTKFGISGSFEGRRSLNSDLKRFDDYSRWLGLRKYELSYEVDEIGESTSESKGGVYWSFFMKDITNNTRKLSDIAGLEYYEPEDIKIAWEDTK